MMKAKVVHGYSNSESGSLRKSIRSGGLEEAVLDKAVVASTANYEMVQEGDAKNLGSFVETTGDLAVLGGRVKTTRRMVMRDDDSAGVLNDSRIEDLTGVDNCAVHKTD
jgi:hypothetical protein